MDKNFISKRITELRIKKNVSEYRMSTDLGHSKGYIQSIASGRTLPSMTEFLYICDYLGVTPSLFFDEKIKEPILYNDINKYLSMMNEDDLKIILDICKRMNNDE